MFKGNIKSDKQTINGKSCSATAAETSHRRKVKTLIYAKPALTESANPVRSVLSFSRAETKKTNYA